MYFGYQCRIPSEDYDTRPAQKQDVARVEAVMGARTLWDGRPVERAADLPVEHITTIDFATGDFLVTWRVPFRLVPENQRA